ncbi:hypothetical protein GCM10009809_16910 [Isoptericola hypogeus]|uniref:DUF1707 domain-containing protein n=1 Tax=Isoptericola hypogeus TaxID=300179 RepID=A0ABN2JBG1_9MICO
MGFLDRLLGRTRDERSYHGVPGQPGSAPPHAGEAPGKQGYAPGPGQEPAGAPAVPGYGASGSPAAHRDPDEVAVERYRYLLRTAPPDAVEQAHAEAFARLTPEQRRRVLEELGSGVPPAERATSDDPQSLARMATRAEMRNPGTLEQSFRGGFGPGGGRGPGFGSMVGASMLGTVAGVVIGTAVAGALFGPTFGDPTQDFAGDTGEGSGSEAGGDEAGADGGADAGGSEADPGAVEASGADGGGFGDFGGGDGGGFGDFGGGDFSGGF